MSNDLYLTPNALTSTGFPGTSLQQTITDRLTNKVLEEGQKKQTQIDSHYEARLATLNQEQDRWIKVKSSVITAQTAANNSLKGAKEIQGTLLEMRSLLARKRDLLAQETTLAASDLAIPENAQGLINVRKQLTETNTKFDNKLAKINQTANSGGKDLNLIGRVKPDFTPNTVELKADLSPVLTKLQGVNLSTSFRLVQADGKVWQADSSSNSIAQYTGLPNENKTNKTGESTSLMNGWGFGHDNGDGTVSIGGQSVVDDTSSPTGEIIVGGATVYDPATSQMEIVVRPNTTSDYDAGGGTYSADLNDFNQPVSGTFEQAGLKMMGSWFYNGLNTTEDIDRAMVDLNKSTATVNVAVSKLTSYTVTVDSANAKVERNFTDLRSKMKEIYTNQALDGMKEQKKTEQAYNATVMNFQSIQNQQELYSNLFRNSYRSPFSGISLDTIA